jgi:hypothetical protein
MTVSVVIPDLNLPANDIEGSAVTYIHLRMKQKERCLDEIGRSIDGKVQIKELIWLFHKS